MSERIQLSKRIRFEVFKRDGFACQYCGRHPPEVMLEIDHIIAVSEGGDATESNLVTACFDCNRGKSSIPLSAVPKGLQERGAEIAEREEQLRGYREIVQAHMQREEADAWEVVHTLFPETQKTESVRRDWFFQIKQFNKRLQVHEVIEAAEIASSRGFYSDSKIFRYFCGVCWRKIKGDGRHEDQEGDNS